MIDFLALALPFLVILVALHRRTEMSLWLLIITMFSVAISNSNESAESMIVFFGCANFILMLAGFMCWSLNKRALPMLIGFIAAFDVIAMFIHEMILINTGSTSYYLGLTTGFTAYLKLFLVVAMRDSKGLLHGYADDIRHGFSWMFSIFRSNKNRESHK